MIFIRHAFPTDELPLYDILVTSTHTIVIISDVQLTQLLFSMHTKNNFWPYPDSHSMESIESTITIYLPYLHWNQPMFYE